MPRQTLGQQLAARKYQGTTPADRCAMTAAATAARKANVAAMSPAEKLEMSEKNRAAAQSIEPDAASARAKKAWKTKRKKAAANNSKKSIP